MWTYHTGNEADAAQSNEGEQNVLNSELADSVPESGRFPNAGKINADSKEYA